MTRRPSSGPEHGFDFWIGEWSVVGAEGRGLGTSSITALFATGALAEHWRGEGGFEGRSLSCYDAGRSRWHQTWVDSTGGLLLLEGGLVHDAMVLEGSAPGEHPAVAVPQRITWSPEPGGVRQHWESCADGARWVTEFDGHYRPA